MKITGYHIANNIIANSENEICDNAPYLDFLLQPKDDTIRVCYHLGYFVANLLKLIKLTKEECIELHEDTSICIYPYELRYIPNKFFSIKKYGRFAYYCDAYQYFQYFDNNSLISTIPSDQYCIRLAIKAKEIGEQAFNSLKDLGLSPTSITSPIRVYEKAVLEKMDLPTNDDVDLVDEEIGRYAYECCFGGWVEAYKIGHFQTVYDYDINSAYPSEAAYLLDLRKGKWRYTKNDIDRLSRYGYYKCKVNVLKTFNPVIYQVPTNNELQHRNYTPFGTREKYLNIRQVSFLRHYNIASVDIIDGWEWAPISGVSYPLNQQITWLYHEKSLANGSNEIKKENIKKIMAGIYGKLTESHEGIFGKYLNTPWSAEIECNTSIKVAEIALQNNTIPIHVAVDGLVTDKQLDINNARSNQLGEWRLNNVAPCICVGSGAIAIQNKEGPGDFSLSYDWLMEQIKHNPDSESYSIKKSSPITLDIAVEQNMFDKIGELREITRTINVGYEEKRYYKKYPKSGKDLVSNIYDSEAWDIGSVIGKNLI